MSQINGKITMSTCEGRPCWVDGRRAIFHRWTDSARPVKPRGMEEDETADRYQLHSVHALVEYEDGTVERVWPNTVRFADSEVYFLDYDWEDMEEQRDRAADATVKDGVIYYEQCDSCKHSGRLFDTTCLVCLDGNRYEPKEGTE